MAVVPDKETVTFLYKNYNGELTRRHVSPVSIRFGSSEWHPEEQWLMLAFDYDRQAKREFALKDVENWEIFFK